MGELSLTWVWSLCSFDLHHKVKERALDPGLPLRQMRCSDSRRTVQERGGQRDRQEGMHWDPGLCLLGHRLGPQPRAVKGSLHRVLEQQLNTTDGQYTTTAFATQGRRRLPFTGRTDVSFQGLFKPYN